MQIKHFVVNGEQLIGLESRVVWCLHCEQVGPVRLDVDDDEECAYCSAGEFDLRDWNGEYQLEKVYQMYSPEFMTATDSGNEA